MAGYNKRSDFWDTEEGKEIKQRLVQMADDTKYNTVASYNANSDQYPDHLMTFVEKHVHYLNVHPKLDASMYLANLQLMTRIRH